MFWILWGVLLTYFLVASGVYMYLHRHRSSIQNHFGMNLAMASSGVIGLATGVVLNALYNSHSDTLNYLCIDGVAVGLLLEQPIISNYTFITIVSTIIAVLIGFVFGTLVSYQMMITGITAGMMSGLMGPMIGAMANNSIGLIMFCSVLFYVTFMLLYLSMRYRLLK